MELKWTPSMYELAVTTPRGVGVYVLRRAGLDWELKVYTVEFGSHVAVDARDEGGNAMDWPSAAMAQLAAQQHYERMCATGETPDVAASRIPTDPAWYEAKMGETP